MLIDILRRLPASNKNSFEELTAELLHQLTGRHFRLAKSGYQAGRDMSSRDFQSNVVAIECKRYGPKTKIGQRELLGEIEQAEGAIPDLDLWILVATRDVDSLLYESLHQACSKRGVEFMAIADGDGTPSSLVTLCAYAPEVIFRYLNLHINNKEYISLKCFFSRVRNTPAFSKRCETLKNQLLSPFVGYDNWRTQQNQWLLNCLKSAQDSRSVFGQVINVEDREITVIRRKGIWNQLDNWLKTWAETRQPLAILGEEGDGKTWSVASWLGKKMQGLDNCPPVLFFSSSNVSDSDPHTLISEAITERFRYLQNANWSLRLQAWKSKPVSDTPLMLLVLDGINERNKPEKWKALLEALSSSEWCNHIAVLITCRIAYWEQHFKNHRTLQSTTCILEPYNDHELNEVLALHDLSRADISDKLLPLIRKPRYFDLMIEHRERMAQSGDVTIERLIYEDWKDRTERKRHIDLDDMGFQELVQELAITHQDGGKNIKTRFLKKREVDHVLSLFSDKEGIFCELTTGGILIRSSRGYKVNQEMLIYGFGLLLVNELYETFEDSGKTIDEVLAQWLEPQVETEIKAAICGFASLHALSLPDLPQEVKVALLNAWVNSQNPQSDIEKKFSAYVPLDPDSYIALAEVVWAGPTENSWAQELLMRGFLRWTKSSEHVLAILQKAFERWLGFVHLYGYTYQRGSGGKDTNEVRQKINERLEYELELGEFTYTRHTLTAINDDGLLRLGRFALLLISHLPRQDFISAIVAGCVADAIMDGPLKYDLFRWVISTARQSLWHEVKNEVEQLSHTRTVPTMQAAYRLLSFEGSPLAYELQQSFPNGLFSTGKLDQQDEEDPCTSGFMWTRENCEACIWRTDLEAQWIARSIKNYCLDPELKAPSNLGERLAPLVKTISPEDTWTTRFATENDRRFEQYEAALCVYAPNVLASLVERITSDIKTRHGEALCQLSLKLPHFYLITKKCDKSKIYDAWNKLNEQLNPLSEEDKSTKIYFFLLVLQELDAIEQLLHLLSRDVEDPDWVKYEIHFRQPKNLDVILEKLRTTNNICSIQRILWFLSVNPPQFLHERLQEYILPLLHKQHSYIRSLVLRIIYDSKDSQATKAIVNGTWAWNIQHHHLENQWGSLLLCKYGSESSYEELRDRIHPIYLGVAVRRRGMRADEINLYADDIHSTWFHLLKDVPDLPSDFPMTELDAQLDQEQNIIEWNRFDLGPSVHTKSINVVSYHWSWGGYTPDYGTFHENRVNHQITKSGKILNETLKQQSKARNDWFLSDFYDDALAEVVEQRPELLEEWLKVLDSEDIRKRLFSLAASFYNALCKVLLKTTPTKGIKLYWQLRRAKRVIIQVETNSRINILDYVLFDAGPQDMTHEAWQQRLEECKNDKALLEVAITAQRGNGQNWLWSYANKGCYSMVPLEFSRAVTMLGFLETNDAFERLTELAKKMPETWRGWLVQTSIERWRSNANAKYWFRRFWSIEDNVLAWAAFRLFLKCVDRRFWLWKNQFMSQTTSNVNIDLEKRIAFFKDNRETIKKQIKKNEEDLKKTLFGQKVQKRQVWPWV